MNKVCKKELRVRILLLISVVMYSVGMMGIGFIPTEGGLVVNFKEGDRFLLSVMIDDVEYFVCDYASYTGGRFNYCAGDSLKLIPQVAGATKPSDASVWTVGKPLSRGKGKELGGIAYTMWGNEGKGKTIRGDLTTKYMTKGALTSATSYDQNTCDVVFVVPTNRSSVVSFDPAKTLGRTDQDSEGRFNGEKGYGFLGMPYREVYWLDIPLNNGPFVYGNASLMTFNTTGTKKTGLRCGNINPGRVGYAFVDDTKKPNHSATPRTIFRLYMLDEPTPHTSSCPDSYFFAYDEQDYKRYRNTDDNPQNDGDSTAAKKIYTIDHLFCMERQGDTKYYQTDWMTVPEMDSAYYYVGYQNNYCHKLGDAFDSQFKKISTLPLQHMDGMYAPKGAFGRMIVDTTKTGEQNLGVVFRPAGVFLRTSSGVNVEMHPEKGDTSWICNQMWTITKAWADLTIKATLFSGPEYSGADSGFDIDGWSIPVRGTDVPLVGGGGSIVGKSGWARIYTNKSTPNGGIEFVLANKDEKVIYDNNGHFGTRLENLYPLAGETKVVLEAARLIAGYEFLGWNTESDGTGTMYQAGDTIKLDTVPGSELRLYAQAIYKGGIDIAISFLKEDGKRYFLTHPGIAPRFATARHFADWTNTYQGMANIENLDPRYLSTYLIIGNNTVCAECADGEYVLDPRRETVHGAVDSVTLYEHFMPEKEEYIGLYYEDPNTVLANNTWAGLFKSTGGWPSPSEPCIMDTKLFSTHYLNRDGGGNIRKNERTLVEGDTIVYDAATNQFNGTTGSGTDFQISGIGIIDEHYIILPDTIDPNAQWVNEITFDPYHDGQTEQQSWSKLIGKQLMLQMTIDYEIVYLHPNDAKTITTPNELRLSRDYNLAQTFEYIRDARVEAAATVEDGDKPHMSELGNEFGRLVTSGVHAPVDVIHQGQAIDIVDTLRITLTPGGHSKIKEYYGRWKKKSDDDGLHIRPDGSRYRDILVRTKTVHYSDNYVRLELTPEYPAYTLSPLGGVSQSLNFTLRKVTARQLLDSENHLLVEEILSTEDITTDELRISTSSCSFTNSNFEIDNEATLNDHVTIVTKEDNPSGLNHDTLHVNLSVEVDGVTYTPSASVPLQQSSLENKELIWSAVASDEKRYFIMAGSGGLIFRQFEKKGGYLYKKEDGKTHLVAGSADAANSDSKYITPWTYTYVDQAGQQLSLKTEYGVDRKLIIDEGAPALVETSDPKDAVTLTYDYVGTNIDDNANFEELVKIKYGDNQWLKLSATPDIHLEFVDNKNDATTFSWTYLKPEYSLREQKFNNEDYPNKDQLVFGYNSTSSASVTACYKARREYSMLLDNELIYCGTIDTYNLSALTNPSGEWRTIKTITIIPDARPGVTSSGLSIKSTSNDKQITTIQSSGASPTEVRSPAGTGPFVDIVDTLYMQYSLQPDAPDYVFRSAWSGFKSIKEANLKIPLIRKTYHSVAYDSIVCLVDDDAYNYTFPPEIKVDENDTYEFVLHTEHREGTNIMDVGNQVVSYTGERHDHTKAMHLNDPALAEIRLVDEYGNTPQWCEIAAKGDSTITVRCKENGIRSPRTANIYIAYTMYLEGRWRYINFRLSVTQTSRFDYANNQHLLHTKGASGDTLVDGVQQVHENKRILYYYNASGREQSEDQRVELPVRDRNFYGWWRWYREGRDEKGNDVADTDVPDSLWNIAPTNTGKWNFPFRIIGDSVPVDPGDPSKGNRLVTQGRYTVFHYPSKDYNRIDPPAKNPSVYPPIDKKVLTYAVDISNYYDNLPLAMSPINNVDTALLDTAILEIVEPTLSLREIFELHPWTEMADTMQHYKYHKDAAYEGQKYMEDHVVRAPIGNRLLLKTEQRYNYDNLKKGQHSESLLGYYMKDDNWYTGDWTAARKDSMIWCGGWDADCIWYVYNPKENTYTESTDPVTENDDFLNLKAKTNITSPSGLDTVIYCLRSVSKITTGEPGVDEETVDGDSIYNICRYVVIYHRQEKFGPYLETAGKAIMTNDEIDEKFDVLERLNFDYNKPGSSYQLYPHPLPWSDASYGFTYPLSPSLPQNRQHTQKDFPNLGEYGLINRIPYADYWSKMEQHGGAANGYMIYCDGMASSGQVVALSLESNLCEGQRLYFSGYVGNPGNQTGNKSCPNFTFSVQGKVDTIGADWEDVTSYMTGDLPQSDKWYQIYFPIEMDKDYDRYRVRVYNMASNNDGNDFIIDDMCIFATKPPLMVYQANTTCKADNEADSLTHVVLRLDYQGFTEDAYIEGKVSNEFYTIMDVSKTNDTTFLKLEDHYYNQDTLHHVLPQTKDTLYGKIPLPDRYYHPLHADSIFPNLQVLVDKFEKSFNDHETNPEVAVFREGYIYEHLDDTIRPVLYIIHSAKMSGDHTYTVHMSNSKNTLMSSKCAMTRSLKVRNRIMLALNGEEQPEKEVAALCNNTTYDVSLRVKGTLLLDNVAPIEVTGTCYNDWLLYGDTTAATSETTYGYKYSDIVSVVRDILRADIENSPDVHNTNKFAKSFAEVNKAMMKKVQQDRNVTLDCRKHPYTVLSWLVNKGYLTLYQSSMTITTPADSTVKYTIFPIPGSGSQVMQDMNIEVCPTPIQIALTSSIGGGLPMIIGGLNRPESELGTPITVLADEVHANLELAIPIDSLMLDEYGNRKVALKQIDFLSTNDPEYLEGIHTLGLVTDRTWSTTGENPGYYTNGNDTLVVAPSPATNYRMRGGYSYTFGIEMMTSSGASGWAGEDGCPVGTVPFTVSVVPDYLRWAPHDEDDSRWNNPDNWIGITPANEVIQPNAHFAPRSTTHVLIPPMTDGKPYPVLPKLDTLRYKDSIQQVGFQYNKCKSIRFLPGGALSQQQRLEYDSVIADLSAPNQKWALRTSPVEGLLSGDIYMSNADLLSETSPWEVGTFDANGRNYNTGNATFWLSLYSRAVQQLRLNEKDSTITSAADWSAVTNAMKMPLKPGQGWAVYTRTKSGKDAAVRLPKNDDVYYYYTNTGKIVWDRYESYLRNERAKVKNPESPDPEKVGKMAFYPGKSVTSEDYTLTNETASTTFVFGNLTMGYIDIWGFIADNTSLKKEFRYIDAAGNWRDVTESSLVGDKDTICSLLRYLPPMQAIELKKTGDAATSLTVTLNTNRIVTDATHVIRPLPAPMRGVANAIRKGIMTVTAVNPVSPRCTSRLLLGQGFHEAVISGEDAVLTTVNINNFSLTSAPATPFNIYALEGSSGLSIDLRDEIVNVPISFYNSELPFDPKSYLWFTGVNNIDGDLVLYDALLDIERPILDGICLEIETPETSHEVRYYIRRPGYVPGQSGENPVATGFTNLDGENTSAVKFIKNGHVFILRDGHVYSIYGQKIR